MIAPCKDCRSRRLGCHSECEAYREFTEFKKQQYADRQDAYNSYPGRGYHDVTAESRRNKKFLMDSYKNNHQ